MEEDLLVISITSRALFTCATFSWIALLQQNARRLAVLIWSQFCSSHLSVEPFISTEGTFGISRFSTGEIASLSLELLLESDKGRVCSLKQQTALLGILIYLQCKQCSCPFTVNGSALSVNYTHYSYEMTLRQSTIWT